MQYLALSKTTVPLAVLLGLSPVAWAVQQGSSDVRLHRVYQQPVIQQAQQHNSYGQDSTPIPPDLVGNWSVTKIIPTQTIGCWDEKQAQQLIGNKISYKTDSFIWNDQQLHNLSVTSNTVEAQEFMEDNSGSSTYVDFRTLGINTPAVQRIIIQHQAIAIPGITDQGSEGVPGDNVMVKDANTLIFSQCGVWFEMQRQKN